MTDSQFEELLAEAIQEYGGDYIEVPEEMWKPHRFSRAFKKRMRKILQKERETYLPRKRIPLRLLIAVIVTAIIAVSATALTVSAFREAIIGFIMDVYETFTNVQAETDEGAPAVLEDIYEVTWVPEGFEVTEDVLLDGLHRIEYKNGEDYIFFRQWTIAEYTTSYNTEYIDMENIEIGSTEGFCILDNDTGVFVWKSDEYVFEIGGVINTNQQSAKELMISMAETVQKVEKAE